MFELFKFMILRLNILQVLALLHVFACGPIGWDGGWRTFNPNSRPSPRAHFILPFDSSPTCQVLYYSPFEVRKVTLTGSMKLAGVKSKGSTHLAPTWKLIFLLLQ